MLSLGLAVGATTAAFRLVDAVLLRPLPVAEPERLFFLALTTTESPNRSDHRDDFDYPTFRKYSQAVGNAAQLMVVGTSSRQEIVIGAGDEAERAYRQYLSGNVFGAFGLQPALGRLIAPGDDRIPGAHPVAVLSYDYWTRRFARDPRVLGRTLRMGNQQYEIVGVSPQGFTGTEPGTMTDVFVPAMMNVQALESLGVSWFRLWVRPAPGVAPEQIRQVLQAVLGQDLRLLPARSGASGAQKMFRRPLFILAALVGLVLLIACANVANLLSAQAATRAREMALRLSIGAGRWRLIQLVLVESALLATAAMVAGMLFASWSAPLVVSMLGSPQDPLRLMLDVDWRALAFGGALTIAVTVLFGLTPALRASSVEPLGALKGGEDPRSPRRVTSALVAAQMAFCVFVLFVAALFVATLDRLSTRPLGFSYDHVLVLDASTRGTPQPAATWALVTDRLRHVPGVESAALSGWAPLTGNRRRLPVRAGGGLVDTPTSHLLDVSPHFFTTMRISLVEGRDVRPDDVPPKIDEKGRPRPGVGLVNESFARRYFDGRSPVGKRVSVRMPGNVDVPMEIVGLVGDAVYSDVREPVPATVYVPVENRSFAAFLVRTAGDPLAIAASLRREVSREHPDFRVRNMATMSQIVSRHMIRERLLATLSLFFALVALLLAGVGLYGVLNHAVIRQRREIGIRMALGARAAQVVSRVATGLAVMVCLGAAAGIAGGLAFGRLVQGLLFQVKATDPVMIVIPILTLAAAAALAALPPAMRAVRIDPAETLRAE